MSSSEEYLESLLKSIMNGENAAASDLDAVKSKSAIEMLTGEGPEDVGGTDAINMNRTLSPEEIEAMFHPAHKILAFESEPALENMSKGDFEPRMDMGSLGSGEITEDNQDGLDNPGDLSDLSVLNDLDALGNFDDLNESGNIDDFGDLSDIDDLAFEERNSEDVLGEIAMKEFGLGDLTIEESSLDDMALEESNMEDMVLEESNLEDLAIEESSLEDMALEESNLEDLTIEESSLDDMALEESNMEDMVLEESGLEDLAIEESDLEDMALEESNLEDLAIEESSLEDMVLEESGEEPEDMDFSDMDGIDDDLAEIGDLLKQSGQDDDVDDEMLALLSSVSDIPERGDDEDPLAFLQDDDSMTEDGIGVEVPEAEPDSKNKKEKKKEKKSLFSKKGKKSEKKTDDSAMDEVLAAADGELSEDVFAVDGAESGQDKAKAKKSGFFSKMVTFLTESDDDEENGVDKALDVIGEPSDENMELLRELNQEDKKNGKKEKANKKKDKKVKKSKKGAGKASGDDEEGIGETKKKKKPKKEKKERKEKKEKKVKEGVEEPREPEKKISKKKVIPIILCCLTITACVVILTSVVPGYLQVRDAHIAFDMANYEEAYGLLQGQRLSEDDELLMQKSRIILLLERKIDSYKGYKRFGMDLEALNALIEGCALYYELLPDAESYNVADQIWTTYGEILVLLSDEYGVSEATVMDILAYEDDVTYTEHLTAIVTGESYSAISGTESEAETETGTVPDVLPEEQEILDNMPVEIN